MLEPRSRRPKSSPTRVGDGVKREALAVRAALERSGWDHGPISVFEKMTSMGLAVPSVAALARIFREAGVARAEPKKKPRAAFRRFVYPAPNACWQLDATEYVLAGGRKCVIFQLQDDHSRLAVASLVAEGETAEAAVAVFTKGVTAHGVPQRLLTDNGAALNPSRRGRDGQLVTYATSLGVEAITGKPGKPTTQGKNERFHQTLFRWLDQQLLAETIEELQALVDRFDVLYNTERRHQGLPGRVTPQQAWDATPVADVPRPKPAGATRASRTPSAEAPAMLPRAVIPGQKSCRVLDRGIITVLGTQFMIGKDYRGADVHAVWDHTHVAVFDEHGTQVITFPLPPKGVRYVGNGKPGGFMAYQSPKPDPSPMS